MRVERLVIESGEETFTLDLHPRLTVVAGIGRVERHSLIGELVGSLGGSRSGVHVEIEQRSGRHLAVFRPTTGAHRVVDVDRRTDVTQEFVGPDGTCDLLRPLGLTSASARQAMRLDAADLATESNRNESMATLAGLDQRRVWAAAEALAGAEADLTTEAEAMGSAPEDACLIDDVERRHTELEVAAERLETTRRRTFRTGAMSCLATVPAVIAAGAPGLLFLVVAICSVVASLAARARLARAAHAEEAALSRAGASSYLGFQLHRVNGLLGDDSCRRLLMGKADARRSALAAWQQLAGDIPVDWALAHREEITATAQLRRDVDVLGALSSTAPDLSEDAAGGLAHALVSHLAGARAVAGEGVPLLLDDPFLHLEPSVKPLLLELLGRTAGQPQIVFLTEDEDVASWARLEALTGELSLIEPAPARPATLDHDVAATA